jgi:nucleotide-binding universal stress UspA family protein
VGVDVRASCGCDPPDDSVYLLRNSKIAATAKQEGTTWLRRVSTGIIVTVAPDVAQGIEADRRRDYQELIESAIAEGRRHSVQITSHLVEAGEVDGVISFLRANKADLLVIGLRQHRSHVARLWSTVASLEEKGPCSVLAVRSRSGARETSIEAGNQI